jgi:CHAD domain-containing protein
VSFNATLSPVEFLTWHSIWKSRSMKGFITSYTKRRLKNLKRLLRSYPSLESLEILHQIRIEIKKIKAVLRLIHYNKKSFRGHKAYLPFRTLFRACGEIREPFVIQSLIDKFKGINTLIVVDQNLTSNFNNHLSTYIRTIKRAETKILPKTEKIKSSTYKDFLKKNKMELENLLYPTFLQRDLHKIRKLIKEIYYLTSIRSKRKDINSFFAASTELIGNWHDKRIVIQRLRKSVPPETELIQKLKTESRSDIRALKKLVQNFYKEI